MGHAFRNGGAKVLIRAVGAALIATVLAGCEPCDWLMSSCDDEDDGGGEASCEPPENADNVASTVICESEGDAE